MFKYHVFVFSFPYLIRIKQCANEIFRSSSKKQSFVHILNSIKYVMLVSSNYLATLAELHTCYKLFIIFTIGFSSYWDLFMDWGLCHQHPKRNISPPIFFACILNVVLRTIAMINFTCVSKIFADTFILNGLEILRRSMWTHLRISNHVLQQE